VASVRKRCGFDRGERRDAIASVVELATSGYCFAGCRQERQRSNSIRYSNIMPTQY
jgi:hypothetical protein